METNTYLRLCNQIVIKDRRRIWNFCCWEIILNDAYSGDASSVLITIWFESLSSLFVSYFICAICSDVDFDGHGAAYSWSDDVESGAMPNRSFNFKFSSDAIWSLARSSSLLVFSKLFCKEKEWLSKCYICVKEGGTAIHCSQTIALLQASLKYVPASKWFRKICLQSSHSQFN